MFQPLSSWIERRQPISQRFYTSGHIDVPKDDWNVWLSIEEVAPLYLAKEMQWLSLRDSREKTAQYLEAAGELISGLEGGWLDRWEQEQILEHLGRPPLPSLPIYLISCLDDSGEELVYVGKTKNVSRFNGGHSAALKLHAPEYSQKQKKIYRSTVWFHDGKEYISLDWVQPEALAHELLDSIESHLIYRFQPALNIEKKTKPTAKWEFYVHIQNSLEGAFLNDNFV